MNLRFADRQLPPLESARTESLLAYLLLHRAAPQPRQRISPSVVANSNESQAQTNLHKVLHTLRHTLPEVDHIIENRAPDAAVAYEHIALVGRRRVRAGALPRA
jgi:DNA-binding SARP family transcriptional activator